MTAISLVAIFELLFHSQLLFSQSVGGGHVPGKGPTPLSPVSLNRKWSCGWAWINTDWVTYNGCSASREARTHV